MEPASLAHAFPMGLHLAFGGLSSLISVRVIASTVHLSEFVGTLVLDNSGPPWGFPFLDRIETLFVAINKLKDEQLRLSLCQSDSRQFSLLWPAVFQQGD